MSRRTGASHSIVALIAVISGSYLKDLLKLYIDAGDIVTHINDISLTLVNQSLVNTAPDTLSVIIVGSTAMVFAFVWGWAYHIKVVG